LPTLPTTSGAPGPATSAAELLAGAPREVLRRLELDVARRLDGLLHGDYRGLVPGHGSEAGDTRMYAPGDDVRRIDWNVTARMQDPHVRETIADRELEAWVLVDRSASLDFGTAGCEKRDLVTVAIAAVGLLTARTGNRVGAVIIDGDRIVTRPARSGRDHLLAILHDLVTLPRHGSGEALDLASGLRRVGALSRRRGLVVAASDWLGPTSWADPLRVLGARHDTLAIEVVDPRELELPEVGMLDLVDPESGRRLEVRTSPDLRHRYAAAAAAQRDEIARTIRQAGADHLQLRTDRDWLLDLVQFVSMRRHRLRHTNRPPIG